MDSRNARPRALSLALLLLAVTLSTGCIVLSLHPAYDAGSIAWEEGLLGTWRAAEDQVEVTVERGEWRSYRVRYKHPVEETEFTAYLTSIGDMLVLDLMPPRGRELPAVLVPGHLLLRLERDGERWLVSAIDYDRARDAVKSGDLPHAALDQRHNVVLTRPTGALREWLRTRKANDFSAPATFERITGGRR